MEGNFFIHDDLVMHILSRLPVGVLLRFRSVSNEWCAVIDSPYFITTHYRFQHSFRTLNVNIPHIVYASSSAALSLVSVQQNEITTCNLTADLDRDSKDMLPWPWELQRISGCVYGIVCLTWKKRDDDRMCFGLWNPATREFKAVVCPFIPRGGVVFEVAGFGFDYLSKDFKILGRYILEEEHKWSLGYEIYSLKTNSWKSLPTPSFVDYASFGENGVYLNGVFYWDSMFRQVHGKQLVIISFSVSSEDFNVSIPPKDACLLSQICHPLQIMVTQCKQSIALLISYEDPENSTLFIVDLWVVTHFDDCGVPISWQHLLSVGPTRAGVGLALEMTLINGDLIFHLLSWNEGPISLLGECCIYKASTSKLKKLRKRFFGYHYRYVESLFHLSNKCFT